MNLNDIIGIILVILIIVLGSVVTSMLNSKGKGKKGMNFGVLDIIGKKLKEIARFVNRQ